MDEIAPTRAPNFRRRLVGDFLPPLLFLAVALVAWQLIAPTGWLLNPLLLPSPGAIAKAGRELLGAAYLGENFFRTVYVIAVGFVIAVVAGLVMGTLMAVVPLLRLVMYPYIIAFQALPKIVLVPLFIVLFGFGAAAKIVTAAAIAFFPVFMNTMIGLSLVDAEQRRLMESLTASRWQVFTKLQIPSALPLIFAGVKVSATYAMTGALAAELIAGTDIGLGRLISTFSFALQMDFVFFIVIVIAVMAYLLFTGMERLGERVVFWGEDQEQGGAR